MAARPVSGLALPQHEIISRNRLLAATARLAAYPTGLCLRAIFLYYRAPWGLGGAPARACLASPVSRHPPPTSTGSPGGPPPGLLDL